ncbi:MAG: NADH:flavin oxidoreductase [Desulfococcaceae bacterium]|jgi:2,4-dienoyl-CoA reductase-like NADH-dependent reductase (Old Yellow Enzyme family)|nr:NADH:flavin oxidoreductase [Desulfococcaceae bacterium]
MSILFESTKIGNLELKNRFVRSATWEGLAAEDGGVTPELKKMMIGLAEGGVGLIISGHAYIRPEGQATPLQLGVYKDELVPALKDMTDAVHEKGGKIVMQLAHAGNFAAEQLLKKRPRVPSLFEGLAESPRKEMTKADIQTLVSSFADAAARAKEAGFDRVQIHSAHGYLLSQFLSPYFNRREDEYGGEIQHRCRVHAEICKAVRGTVGKDYPLLIKLNCRDFTENGLDADDSLAAAKMLTAAGVDAIELSGGLLSSPKMSPSRMGIKSPEKEAYFREDALRFKKEISLPIILVGGIRSFEIAEEMVESGTADYLSMSRPLIREPHLIRRWKEGDRRKAECLSDNLCFRPGFAGKGIYCVSREREGK